ncbi:MAG TPA: GspH/FimT family protein [Burkholderiaceae bacterium]|nr:GspH/FimT family protein [Burkholderiaceae bacterium]
MWSIHPATRTRGSSLVETLVATSLGLLALVMSTNSVLAVVVGEGHAGTARALMRSVEFARSEAAQRSSPVAICGLDPRDIDAPAGQVRCLPPGSPWQAGWIVFGDANLNGELDDGEAVLQVNRGSDLVVYPQDDLAATPLSFRPIGTLASATPRRLLVGRDAAQSASTQAVCVAIDGFVRVLPAATTCQ